jgi:hypothetical protein
MQFVCVMLASKSDDPIYIEPVITLLGSIVLVAVVISDWRLRKRFRIRSNYRIWTGLAGFFIWQFWLYPISFGIFLRLLHSPLPGHTWVRTPGGVYYYIQLEYANSPGDGQSSGQAYARPPWIYMQ